MITIPLLYHCPSLQVAGPNDCKEMDQCKARLHQAPGQSCTSGHVGTDETVKRCRELRRLYRRLAACGLGAALR